MKKYKSVPASLAYACLVRMIELIENSAVFTVDSDCHIYGKNGRQNIDLIMSELLQAIPVRTACAFVVGSYTPRSLTAESEPIFCP
jgi:hypothetical protein